MSSGITRRFLPVLLVGPLLGGLAVVASLALHETSAVAAGATTCGVTGTTANVTLDQTASPFTSTLTQDGSGNLLVNGTACGNFSGGSALTTIDLVDASGATNQLVVLDQTGAGGIFPCTAAIEGTLGATDTVKVVGASSEDLAVGDSAPSVAGVDLNSCSSGQIGAITGAGHYWLVGGAGVLTLSAAGDAAIASPLSVPATLQPSSGSSQALKGGAAGDTIDFSSVSTTVNPLIVNVSGSLVTGVANNTAAVGAVTYDFTSGSANFTTFVGAATGNTTFYAGSSAITFDSSGPDNTLSFANAPGSSLLVCVVHAAGCSGANQAQLGATVEPFSGITTFVGLAGGNTDFVTGRLGGFSFEGNGSGNLADFSGATSGVHADLNTGTVQVASGTDTFSGISTVVGSSAGSNTFVAGSANETFIDGGVSGGDTVDFSNVATSTSSPLTVNVSGGPVNTVANGTAAVGPFTYTFTSTVSNFTNFIGSSSGHTDFLAGPTGGHSFSGSGSGDTLDLSAMAAGPTVDLSGGTTGTVCVTTPCTSNTDTISGLTTVTGSSAGSTTFVGGSATYDFTGHGNTNIYEAGSGPETISDSGSGNAIDFSALTVPLTVNVSGTVVGSVANDTAATSSSTYTFTSFGSVPAAFKGAATGNTTFYAGSSADAFTGAGPFNTLNFADASGSSLLFCVVHAGACSGANQAQLGATVEPFSGISIFVGLALGNTDFVAGDLGGFTFTASGTGNNLDFSGASHGVDVDFHAGTVSLFGGGTDIFSGISTAVGSSAGSNTFVAGSANETFIDGGVSGGDTLDFSNVPTSTPSALTVNVSGAPVNTVANGTAAVGSFTYTFTSTVSNFTTFIGSSSGHTDFLAGPTGGRSFSGSGSGNTLDLSAMAAGPTVDLSGGTSGTVCVTPTCLSHDTISGLTTVTGSSAGSTTFVGGSATYVFTGAGNTNIYKAGSGPETISDSGSGNTIDFSALSVPLTVNVSGTTVGSVANDTAATSSSTYTFTSFGSVPATFKGAATGNTTFYAGSSANTFDGTGPANTLSFADASGSSLLFCVVHAGGCSGANQAQLGATVEPFSGISTFDGLAGGNTTFVAGDTGGFTFNGSGSGNVADFSGAGHGVDANLHTGSVRVNSGTVTFSGIPTFIGSSSGANTFVAGSANETFSDTGSTGGDTVDFTNVATSTPSPLIVNVSGGPVNTVANGTAGVGSTTYSFTDAVANFTTFIGASSGHTDFLVGPSAGHSFTGAGSGNTLDLSAMAAGPTVDLSGGTTGTVCVATPCTSATDTIAGLTTVTGSSAGSTTFVGGSSTYSFTGAANTNTFKVGSGSETISDPGNGNTIDFSALSIPLTVNVSGGTVGPVANNTAATSSSTYSFSSVPTTFDGAAAGNTTFYGGAPGGDTFDGTGTGNVADFSSVPSGNGAGLTIDLHVGLVTSVHLSDDSIHGITTVVGSREGYDDFVAGSGNLTISDVGSTGHDTVDFSHVATSAPKWLTVNVSGAPVSGVANGTASVGSTTYSFTNIVSNFVNFIGASSGYTTFVAGPRGTYDFTGSAAGPDNKLDLSAAPLGTTVTVSGPGAGTVTGLTGGGVDLFTGIQIFAGPVHIVSPVSALPAVLPTTTAGLAYGVQLTGTGGTAPYSGFVVQNGSLPPGFSLSGSGMLSGSATRAGTFSFVVSLLDANQVLGATSYTLTVNAPPPGYYNVASDGGIFNYGGAAFYGSMGGQHLNAPIVGMAETPFAKGYWEVGSDGGIFNFGNAAFYGSTGSIVLNKPIVGMAATPSGWGYWLVASDGGIFNYGDAGFFGSAGSIPLNKPIVGMAATPSGRGYWLVASDGGIFTYGDAAFFGSTGSIVLNKPIVGMAATPSGRGYWLVASDGGIFTYGDAGFFGSAGSIPLNKPIVAMISTPSGQGYWLVASDGGIFNYGDAAFLGSAGGLPLNAPVVGGTAG